MLGTPSHPAGATTLLHTVRNPITLAKTILFDPEVPHVFLGGEEAEKYAREQGLEIVDPGYFWTEARWKQHLEGLGKGRTKDREAEGFLNGSWTEKNILHYDAGIRKGECIDLNPMGTVGAVAVDYDGVIAVATSTGKSDKVFNIYLVILWHD